MTIKPGLILCCISFYMQIVSVFDCAASSNILVSNRAVLESVEGPYNPELFVTYPITIEIQNPDTVAFSFFLEYPFWGMVPAIESSSNAIIVNATEQIDENNIHIDVSCNFDLETDADALTITFSGTKRQFFDSIQFFYGYPPTPPIRHFFFTLDRRYINMNNQFEPIIRYEKSGYRIGFVDELLIG